MDHIILTDKKKYMNMNNLLDTFLNKKKNQQIFVADYLKTNTSTCNKRLPESIVTYIYFANSLNNIQDLQ